MKKYGLAFGIMVVLGALLYAGPSIFSVYQGGTGVSSMTAHGVVMGEGTSPVAVSSAGTTGQCLVSNGSSSDPTFQTCTIHGVSFTIGDPGAASPLSAASTTTDYVTVPFGCTIAAYNLAIDAGTITVKFWKIGTGTAIPTSANSINTSGVSVSSGTAIHSTTLSDFTTTTVTANDILAMNVTAVSTAKYVNGVLQCQ